MSPYCLFPPTNNPHPNYIKFAMSWKRKKSKWSKLSLIHILQIISALSWTLELPGNLWMFNSDHILHWWVWTINQTNKAIRNVDVLLAFEPPIISNSLSVFNLYSLDLHCDPSLHYCSAHKIRFQRELRNIREEKRSFQSTWQQ